MSIYIYSRHIYIYTHITNYHICIYIYTGDREREMICMRVAVCLDMVCLLQYMHAMCCNVGVSVCIYVCM